MNGAKILLKNKLANEDALLAGDTLLKYTLEKIHCGNRSLKAVRHNFQKTYDIAVYRRSVKVQRQRHSGNLRVLPTTYWPGYYPSGPAR